MNSAFTHAPVIGHDPKRGIYLEAEPSRLNAVNRSELARLTREYGYLVGRGGKLTGAQWAHQIEMQHAGRVHLQQELDCIRFAMSVDHFADDCILFSRERKPLLRGSAADCEIERLDQWSTIMPTAECSGGELLLAEMNMACQRLGEFGAQLSSVDEPARADTQMFVHHFLPFATHWRYGVHASEGSSLASALALLQHKCVGPETFSDEQNASDEGAYTAMAEMVRHLGYSSFVTANPPRARSQATAADPAELGMSAEVIADKLYRFIGEMLERGWDSSKPVFLCRPAPALSPGASARHFESILHEQLIAWRLPVALVERVVERIEHGQVDGNASLERRNCER
ncbi:MAG TPA: hypothetical protein VN259_07490 [Xanthomonadales bacterium]|nr:hypothetical protein [Xanthomonadales bacterium]